MPPARLTGRPSGPWRSRPPVARGACKSCSPVLSTYHPSTPQCSRICMYRLIKHMRRRLPERAGPHAVACPVAAALTWPTAARPGSRSASGLSLCSAVSLCSPECVSCSTTVIHYTSPPRCRRSTCLRRCSTSSPSRQSSSTNRSRLAEQPVCLSQDTVAADPTAACRDSMDDGHLLLTATSGGSSGVGPSAAVLARLRDCVCSRVGRGVAAPRLRVQPDELALALSTLGRSWLAGS